MPKNSSIPSTSLSLSKLSNALVSHEKFRCCDSRFEPNDFVYRDGYETDCEVCENSAQELRSDWIPAIGYHSRVYRGLWS